MMWVVEQYWSKSPEVVLDTADVATFLLGQERNEEWREAVRYALQSMNDPGVRMDGVRNVLVAGLAKLPESNDFDFLLPWVAKQLLALLRATDDDDTSLYTESLALLRGKAPVIAMWAKAERKDIGRVSLQEAFEAIVDFEASSGDVEQGEVVYRFPDGFTVQNLSAECLDDEGAVMQHCVGGYGSEVAAGRIKIFSLRDKAGRPHATIEWDLKTKRVRQVKGKQNEAPAEKYQAKVDEFLKEKLGVKPLTALEREIVEVLEEHGEWAHGGNPEGVARSWTWVENADQVRRWLDTNIWDGAVAESLTLDGATAADVRSLALGARFLREYLAAGGEWSTARIAGVLSKGFDDKRRRARRELPDEFVMREAKAWATRYDFDEFEQWLKLGVSDVKDADRWEDIGKPGDPALLSWIDAFGADHSRDALPWFEAGVTDPEIAKALEDMPEHGMPKHVAAVYEPGMSAEDVLAALEEEAAE